MRAGVLAIIAIASSGCMEPYRTDAHDQATATPTAAEPFWVEFRMDEDRDAVVVDHVGPPGTWGYIQMRADREHTWASRNGVSSGNPPGRWYGIYENSTLIQSNDFVCFSVDPEGPLSVEVRARWQDRDLGTFRFTHVDIRLSTQGWPC